MMSGESVVSLIPARGGSKGLKNKNIYDVCGKPLISYTIEQSKRCGLIEYHMVLTDSKEIADISREYGATIPFLLPYELTTDCSPLDDSLGYFVREMYHIGQSFDIGVLLEPTNIFRTDELIIKVIRKLIDNPEMDSIFVVYPDNKNYWRKDNEGTLYQIAPRGNLPRQLKEPLYRECSGLVCASRSNLLSKSQRIGKKFDIVVHNDQTALIDIHDTFDISLIEYIIESGLRTV